MTVTIFYSWQSDTRAAANRSLIQDALEAACKDLRADDSIAVEPVVDRDTQAVPGAPDIGATTFEKIEASAVFVADVTIVNRPSSGRPSPNPNVLIELGYALKALEARRVILVQNVAFGGPEDLPFDLLQKRALTYNSPEDAPTRAPERRQLQAVLREALALVLGDSDTYSPKMSERAKRLLIAAADSDGNLMRIHGMEGLSIKAGGQWMNNKGDRRDDAAWDSALQELIHLGLAEPRGPKGEILAVTHAGYELADILKTAKPSVQ